LWRRGPCQWRARNAPSGDTSGHFASSKPKIRVVSPQREGGAAEISGGQESQDGATAFATGSDKREHDPEDECGSASRPKGGCHTKGGCHIKSACFATDTDEGEEKGPEGECWACGGADDSGSCNSDSSAQGTSDAKGTGERAADNAVGERSAARRTSSSISSNTRSIKTRAFPRIADGLGAQRLSSLFLARACAVGARLRARFGRGRHPLLNGHSRVLPPRLCMCPESAPESTA
jgi:hypothetical protein